MRPHVIVHLASGTSCHKEFEKWQEQGIQQVPTAANIAGACNYGFGTLNVVLSSLPPTVLALAGFLGMKADLDTGLSMLDMSYYSQSMYSNLAAMIILNYRSVRIMCVHPCPIRTRPLGPTLFCGTPSRWHHASCVCLRLAVLGHCARKRARPGCTTAPGCCRCRALTCAR